MEPVLGADSDDRKGWCRTERLISNHRGSPEGGTSDLGRVMNTLAMCRVS